MAKSSGKSSSKSSSAKGTSKVGSSGYKSPTLAARAAKSAATYKPTTISTVRNVSGGTAGGASGGATATVSQVKAAIQKAYPTKTQVYQDFIYKQYTSGTGAAAKNATEAVNKYLGVPETSGAVGIVDETGQVQQPAQQTAEQTAEELRQQRIQSALEYLKTSGLPAEWLDIFSTAVKNWNADTEINIPNIIENFKKIQSEKIDPHYKGLIDLAVADLQNEFNKLESQKTTTQQQYETSEALRKSEQSLSEEQAKVAAEANIRGSRADLEARGLTFTGEARRQLGGESAFAQGDVSKFPELAIPFGGTETIEGLIPQANRMVATSLEARRKAAEEDYARALSALNQQFQTGIQGLGIQAESKFGSTGVPSFLSSYYKPTGGVTGDIEAQKRTDLGNVATYLTSQAQGNANTSVNLPSYFSY